MEADSKYSQDMVDEKDDKGAPECSIRSKLFSTWTSCTKHSKISQVQTKHEMDEVAVYLELYAWAAAFIFLGMG